MKKLPIALVLILLVSLCALTMTACDSELNAPSGLLLDPQTLELRWNAVKGAKYYVIEISGQEQSITTKTPSVSLEDLRAGEYEIKIRAHGDDQVYGNSEWTTYSFTREQESGLRYQLIQNGTAYELIDGGTAEGDVVMEDVFRGKPVVSIAKKALYGNGKITGFTVGKNVTTIGEKAFAKCTQLTSVVIPEGVQSIGEYAFQSCKALGDITLPNSVTVIQAHTFAWCDAMTQVTVGNNLQEIGAYAFSNCEALEKITFSGCSSDFKACLPDSLLYVGKYAFADCYGLKDMDLGDNMEVIATYAFANCSQLARVDLGSKLMGIGDYAFVNCLKLNGVVIPDTTLILTKGVFYGCADLMDVTLGSGLTSLGAEIFEGTAILANAGEQLVINGWLIRYLNENADTLRISSDIYGIASKACAENPKLSQVILSGVKYVGDRAFYKCPNLYNVRFDDALLELGNYAFFSCQYLKSVNLGNSLQIIGSYAFASCKSLTTVDIPDTVTTVGVQAFRKTAKYNEVKSGVVYMGNWAVDFVDDGSMGVTVLAEGTRGIANYTFTGIQWVSVIMADSVEYVGRGAFLNSRIFLIGLSRSLKYIDDYAFYGCDSTNFGGATYALVIPETTEYIGRSAFYGCGSILSVIIPGSVKTIGDYAFYDCLGLGETAELSQDSGKVDEAGNPIYELVPHTGVLQLGEGIETIGVRAFQGCNHLTTVTIPNSVTSLGSHAFYKCQSLENVTLGTGITQIADYTFYKCSALKSVVTLGKVGVVGKYAFAGCEALEAFHTENAVAISKYAFYGCGSLKQLVFGNQLTTIGDYAFRGCSGIQSFVIPESVATIGKHAFYGLNNTTLYCEAASLPAGWHEYFNSSFRPVFWNCVLSEDGSYVISVLTGTCLDYSQAIRGISEPCCVGYVFRGWATDANAASAEYTMETVAQAPAGQPLYALWSPVDYTG